MTAGDIGVCGHGVIDLYLRHPEIRVLSPVGTRKSVFLNKWYFTAAGRLCCVATLFEVHREPAVDICRRVFRLFAKHAGQAVQYDSQLK